jgi:DNA-directed RNA polymerase subunit beta'
LEYGGLTLPKDLLPNREMEKKEFKFDAIRISLASPEKIRQWSRGEVKKPETINYRTFKPEKDGLFCERIFGPTKDWECNCGKYKRIRHRNVICDRCGVEVTLSKVRRERLGHIELSAPVSHIWYLKGIPSRIGYMMDMSTRYLEKVVYYESYIVIDPGNTPLQEKQLLNDEEYRKMREQYGDAFKAGMGAEAVKGLLARLDLKKLAVELRDAMRTTTSVQKKKEIVKRLKVVEAFRKSTNKPEWMILDVIPVIPPELRPLVPLDGGRFATSDANDLYRRVINRNNRLKRLMELRAPSVIIRNEKRMLQEAVDALFDNGRRGHAVKGPGNRPLKSLSDMLKGKHGRFRQNLLGKRVDYSGRSVIVVGPELKLYQCGLPKKMALELFKPFIIKKLEDRGYVQTIKSAKKMVEKVKPEVWDILEEVLQDHPVLLNRAPTLHRQGIQAFQPVLVEGKAIRIHPLVCAAFNADFDGDQMAVHVPLSTEAQLEAKLLMLASNNVNSMASGKPIVVPSQDIVLGCYYLSKEKAEEVGENRLFYGPEEVILAYESGQIGLHTRIKVRIKNQRIDTTVGRVLFNQIIPDEMGFVNKVLTKKELGQLVSKAHTVLTLDQTIKFLDDLKNMGFKYATRGGLTVSIDDMKIPQTKSKMILEARKEVNKIAEQYQVGVITDGERYNKVIDIWTRVTDELAEEMMLNLKQDQGGFNPIYMMADSGARGSKMQIRQLAGMRGLMAKPQQRITGQVGEIIESPIIANFREGLTVLEYFISTHGARKGLADTALKTADAGYLTRRLVDVAQDVIVNEPDCKTVNGIFISPIKEGTEIIEPLKDRIVGRVALDNVVDLFTDEILVRANEIITEESALAIEKAGIEKIRIRSVLTCESRRGVCALCYGHSLSDGKLVDIGEPVGIIAAQSIGEPGTQLTLRTFHVGGTASRVVEQSRLESKEEGQVRFSNVKMVKNKKGELVVLNRNGEMSIFDSKGIERELYTLSYGTVLNIKEGQKVKKGELLATWDLYSVPIFTEVTGTLEFEDIIDGITMREKTDEITGLIGRVIVESKDEQKHPQIIIKDENGKKIAAYAIPTGAYISVENGNSVYAGDILAKMPREISKTRDITGGLPRVAELFEARRPKAAAIITELDGLVAFLGTSKGMRKLSITNDEGIVKEYLIPSGRHINVREGDRVLAGEQLTDGPVNPHDILDVKGVNEVQSYLVDKVQEVYRLQGVGINDKHIEVIVRQMMRKIVIDEPGETEFLPGMQVDRFRFLDENKKVQSEGKQVATARPALLGITKASLGTESFISAASFQETTRVLTEAAVAAKIDDLRGLKENVIMGHLISAGTGMLVYQKHRINEKNEVLSAEVKEIKV